MNAAGLAPEPAAAAERRCENCETSLIGAYCYGCGASGDTPRDLSMRRFAGEAASELTNVEHSKLLRTLHALLLRPGHLTREYFSARRARYIKPLALSLAIFGLSLLVFSSERTTSMFNLGRLVTIAQAEKDGGAANPSKITRAINDRAERRGISTEALTEQIGEDWARVNGYLQVPQTVLLAFLLLLVFARSGRYLVEHLVFSLHFFSFAILTTVLLWPAFYLLGMKPGPASYVLMTLKFLVDTVYLFLAIRTFYRQGRLGSALRAPIIFLGYFGIYLLGYGGSLGYALWANLASG